MNGSENTPENAGRKVRARESTAQPESGQTYYRQGTDRAQTGPKLSSKPTWMKTLFFFFS